MQISDFEELIRINKNKETPDISIKDEAMIRQYAIDFFERDYVGVLSSNHIYNNIKSGLTSRKDVIKLAEAFLEYYGEYL